MISYKNFLKKKILALIILISTINSYAQFTNDYLKQLEGNYKGEGQIIALKDGYFLQITQYDLEGYIPKGSNSTMLLGKNNLVWILKINIEGKIEWITPFDNGCSSHVFKFKEHHGKFIGFVTDCNPEILIINSKGIIEKRKKIKGLKSASLPQVLPNGDINFIGEKIIFEGFVPTKYDPDLVYLSTVVGYQSIFMNTKLKITKEIKLDSLELEDQGEDFPVFNRTNRYYYLPWKNGLLYQFNKAGKNILKYKLPTDNRTNEAIYSDFITNSNGDFVFCRTNYYHVPNRHLGKIEILSVDTSGKQIFCTEINGPTTWNSRDDLIQTTDKGYIYIMYTNKLTMVKLDMTGNIEWKKEYPELKNTILHMSISESSQGDLAVLAIRTSAEGDKPFIIHFDSLGKIK